jgi:hypothetical protein
MVSEDGAPIALTVPDGTDSVELLYGAIEPNPGIGSATDLDEMVTVGDPALIGDAANGKPLAPGSEITIRVPWRAASRVDLDAGRLRVPLVARFYSSTQN